MATAKAEMKTLTLEETTFEIVDAKARDLLGNKSVEEQISQATLNMVTDAQLEAVTATITQLEKHVDEKVLNTEQLQTDLQTYVDEQIKLVKPDHIDDGEI